MEYKVGQRMYRVPTTRPYLDPHYVEITKVGRVYLTCGHRRYFLDGLREDCGQYVSVSRLFNSSDEYERHVAREKKWDELCDYFHRRRYAPEGLTLDAINAIIESLP